ncbi:MAG: PIN domain-containing protein [Eubacterium sp.]|nr:PIN domain-containing protein [Eubacterium sp.]
MRVLLDTNVIVDVLQRREPWFADGQKIFYAIANKQIIGCITAKEAADIHFFSRKQFVGEENVDAKARNVMTKLYAIFELIDTLGIDCQNAIAIENKDYEDAIMIESAKRAGVDCIVTRNLDHFKLSPIPVYSPSEFVVKISEEQKS